MKHLVRDLEHLKKEILTVGALVEEATNKAITALVDRRPELAEEVLAGDDEIDRLEVAIEEECLKVLALHQPVASDLRFVVTILKVNNDLERMGDHAANIAERAAFLCSQPAIDLPIDLRRIALRVRDMVRGSLDALVNVDVTTAHRVIDSDPAIDAMHRDMYQGIQDLMRRSPETIERAVNTISASRHLERIADLSTNIAEDVIFLVEGEVIRHRSS